ncbi:putative carrier protein [Leishmania infantum JPCM5]|uniref:Carrier_protein_-_putative n=2 Tax=Leishmania infantum TaxID=5671 RepID=A0A6L0WJX4_LEIIN|nr:putative carrier protein [Leishmania infantum JPCM5]CAC9458611.1 carrier_protein_-_putative [Leishmania infantum]CAM66122.2 putative carrier protein [Leishmania infantum JPCM5]SUZ39743.1 carrier_protein_-_putative [Leishmania infantum]|eukprot:XP_001463754.2 putative carrier protein [Leishmania infantum JPCM5]
MLTESSLMEADGAVYEPSAAHGSTSVHAPHHHHNSHHHTHTHQAHQQHSSASHPHSSPLGFLTHDVEEDPPLHEHTTSVNRSYSDLHQGAFLCYAFGLCALRTALQHPMNLALARKQTSAAANTMTTWGVLSHIFAHEGRWRGLLQGIGSLSMGCALSEVIYLCIFEWGREQVPIDGTATRDAISGYVADVMCRSVHIPLSIIAYRQMTASPSRRMNSWRTLQHMYSERGLRTVFAGFGTTLVVGCQWTAIWWAMYGRLKSFLYDTSGPHLQRLSEKSKASQRGGDAADSGWRLPSWCISSDDNVLINGAASVTTSAATAVLFNPYLVVRTNLQVTPGATLWSVTRQLHRRRGFRGFYSGLLLSVNACVVDGVLASTSYEYAKLWADRTRDGHAR